MSLYLDGNAVAMTGCQCTAQPLPSATCDPLTMGVVELWGKCMWGHRSPSGDCLVLDEDLPHARVAPEDGPDVLDRPQAVGSSEGPDGAGQNPSRSASDDVTLS